MYTPGEMDSYYSPERVRKYLEKWWLLEEGIKPKFLSDEPGRPNIFSSPYEDAIIIKCDLERAISLLHPLKRQAIIFRYVYLYRHGKIKHLLKLSNTKVVDNLIARARVDMARILGWRPPKK